MALGIADPPVLITNFVCIEALLHDPRASQVVPRHSIGKHTPLEEREDLARFPF